MEKEYIVNGNHLICKFIGLVPVKTFIGYSERYQINIESIHYNDGSFTDDLNFHSDWNWIMAVWDKIISMDKSEKVTVTKNQVSFHMEINKHSILLRSYKYISRKIGWKNINIYHDCKTDISGLYVDNLCDSINMKEVYYKTIIDFLNFYYE